MPWVAYINLLHDRGASLYGRVLKVREIHHYEDESGGEQDNVADRPRKTVLKEPVYKPR